MRGDKGTCDILRVPRLQQSHCRRVSLSLMQGDSESKPLITSLCMIWSLAGWLSSWKIKDNIHVKGTDIIQRVHRDKLLLTCAIRLSGRRCMSLQRKGRYIYGWRLFLQFSHDLNYQFSHDLNASSAIIWIKMQSPFVITDTDCTLWPGGNCAIPCSRCSWHRS